MSRYNKLFSKWPWLVASAALSVTVPWWLAATFAFGCVFVFNTVWPAVLSGFLIDSFFGSPDDFVVLRYKFTIIFAVLTPFIMAIKKRMIFYPDISIGVPTSFRGRQSGSFPTKW